MEAKAFIRAASICAIAGALTFVSCGIKMSPKPPLKAAPPKVQTLTLWPREDHNLLKWTAPAPAKDTKETLPVKFVIQRWIKPPDENLWSDVQQAGESDAQPEAKEITFKDKDVKPGFAYRYRVIGVDSEGKAGEPSPVVQASWDVPPGAPGNLRAEAGNRFVSLDWDAPAGDVRIEGYFVYRETEAGFVRVIEDAAPGDSFLDAALSNGETYHYVVRATRMAGTNLVEGPASEVIEVKPADVIAPMVPVGVDAFPVEGGVLVRWWPNEEPDLAGYFVYRSEKGVTARLNSSPLSEAQYLDGGAQTGHVYIYTVTAVDTARNESQASEPARVYVKR